MVSPGISSNKLVSRNEEVLVEARRNFYKKISEDKKNKEVDKKRNAIMKIGMIQDEFNPEVKIKEKEEKPRRNPIKKQRTRGTFIRALYNITFNNGEM